MKFNKINKIFEINKIEIIEIFIKFNKKLVVICNLKIKFKNKIKNKFSNFQNVKFFENINYDKIMDFFKIYLKNKPFNYKPIDLL